MKIDIVDNLDQASKFIKTFGAQGERGVSRALNRAIKGVSTDSVKLVREDYNVKARTIREGIKVRRATGKVLEGAAVVSGRRIPLLQFSARPAKPGGRKPLKGVSVQVKHSRKTIRHAFVARMKTGHTGVFQRETPSRLPIAEKFSYAVPEMLDQPETIKVLEENAINRFNKALDQEINYAFQKMGAR